MEKVIKLIQKELNVQVEDKILKAVSEVGIDIDKERLVKLIKRNTPINVRNDKKGMGNIHFDCPECKHYIDWFGERGCVNYCPFCGQRVEVEYE